MCATFEIQICQNIITAAARVALCAQDALIMQTMIVIYVYEATEQQGLEITSSALGVSY